MDSSGTFSPRTNSLEGDLHQVFTSIPQYMLQCRAHTQFSK